jgi:precorrin-4 C11-methyltransferase
MNVPSTAKVYFIGAGPGDQELITVKGKRILSEASLVLYAGSLVSTEIMGYVSEDAERHNTAGMNLKSQIDLMSAAVRQGKTVARLHTGDPSIYGAIDEQMHRLDREGIPYEVVPGVSSVFAAAAALGLEFTLPAVTQTLILTRMDGRTPMPESEKLRSLAAHNCSLAIFLSTGMITSVVEELLSAGYSPSTPIAVVYRASWPDQLSVRGTLADIADKLEKHELTHQGMIIVSPALKPERSGESHLYGSFQQTVLSRNGTAILALTAPASNLGRQLKKSLPDSDLWIPERFLNDDEKDNPSITGFHDSIRQVLQSAFNRYANLICIMASGIVVRELAPLLVNKHTDPAVVVMDPVGRFAVSLLSGHERGANRLAQNVAAITGGEAVITTATDNNNVPALDVLACEYGWKMDKHSHLAGVAAAMVNGDLLNLICPPEISLPEELEKFPWSEHHHCVDVDGGSEKIPQVIFTYKAIPNEYWNSAPVCVVLYPPVLAFGIGCNRGTPSIEILEAVNRVLTENDLAPECVCIAGTITDKANEPGLVEACRTMGWEMRVYSHEDIAQVENIPNPSEVVRKTLGVAGVAEPAAILSAGADHVLVAKQKFPNVTVAVAIIKEGG